MRRNASMIDLINGDDVTQPWTPSSNRPATVTEILGNAELDAQDHRFSVSIQPFSDMLNIHVFMFILVFNDQVLSVMCAHTWRSYKEDRYDLLNSFTWAQIGDALMADSFSFSIMFIAHNPTAQGYGLD